MAKKKYSPLKGNPVPIWKPEVKKPEPVAKPNPRPVEYKTVYIEATVKKVVHSKNLLVVSKPIHAGKGATLIPYIELTKEVKERLS